MDNKRLRFLKTVLHPFFSVCLSFLFIITFYTYLHNLLLHQFFPAAHPVFIFLLAAVALGESVSANALMKQRIVGIAPRIREIVLFLLFSFLFLMIFTGDVFEGDLSPLKGEILFPLVLILIEWIICFVIHRALKRRELFIQLTGGKSGKELVNAVRELFKEAGDSKDGRKTVKRFIIIFQAIVLVLLLAVFISFDNVKPIWILLGALHSVLSFLAIISLNHAGHEEELLGSGLRMDKKLRRRRNGAAFFFLLLCFCIVFPLSSDNSVFSAQAIADFLVRVNDMMNLRPLQVDDTQELVFSQTEADQQTDYSAQQVSGKIEGRGVLADVVKIIGMILLVLAGVFFIYFLIKPLFSRGNTEKKSFSDYVSRILAGIKRGWERVTASPRLLLKWIKRQRETIGSTTRTLIEKVQESRDAVREVRRKRAEQRSEQKRVLSNTFVKEYLTLIRWAERNGRAFRKSMGPLRFLEHMAELFPEKREELMKAGSLFEEAMYSGRALDKGTVEEFSDLVKSINKLKARART
jgi:hypothetical protein